MISHGVSNRSSISVTILSLFTKPSTSKILKSKQWQIRSNYLRILWNSYLQEDKFIITEQNGRTIYRRRRNLSVVMTMFLTFIILSDGIRSKKFCRRHNKGQLISKCFFGVFKSTKNPSLLRNSRSNKK